jgi:hypothetical protein
VNEASDAIVCIEISEKEAALVQLYAVISDVYPSVTKWPQNHVENPRLRGMIQGYRNQFDRKEYMEQMMMDTVRSFYLVPAKLQAVEDFDGDIMDTLRKNASVRFFAVMTKNIPDAEALPVFTDWEALSHYRELMGQERAITVVMDFTQMTDILNQGYSAVVVNAFGPQPFYLSKEYIAMIKKTEISDKNENQEKE